MSRSPEGPDSDLLFDLPLDRPSGPATRATEVGAKAADGSEGGGGDQVALTFAPDEEPQPTLPVEAPPAVRFTAALLDLVALVAVLGFSLLALRLLEIPADRRMIAPLLLFLGSFSFLYQVVPLAFWGHTPGMAYAGIHSRDRSGGFMTIQQCMLRWVGWVLTLASGGLAGLMALSGVSLSDVLSRTRSYIRPS